MRDESSCDVALPLRSRRFKNGEVPELFIIITVEAWDGNCNSHIPHLIPAEEAAKMIDSLNQKIGVLQTELEVCGPPDVASTGQ
jgi:hypothetical protein